MGTRWHVKHCTPEAPVYRYLFTLDAFGVISFFLGAAKYIHGKWRLNHFSFDWHYCTLMYYYTFVQFFYFFSGAAGHADDLGYVFKLHLLNGLEVPEPDRVRKGIDRMTELIKNFVVEG